MLRLIDFLLPSIWILLLADLLLAALVAVPMYLVVRRTSSPDTWQGRLLRALCCVAACIAVITLRASVGPAFRLALTSAHNRPQRRFADRLGSSAEIQAFRGSSAYPVGDWLSEYRALEPPRFLAFDVERRGLRRLGDRELMQRNDILARATQGEALCWNVSRSSEDAVDLAIRNLPVDVQEIWFDLKLRAVLAEVRGAPPARTCDRDAAYFDVLMARAKRRHENASIIGGSAPRLGRRDCLVIQELYANLVTGQGRPALDLCLAAEVPYVWGTVPKDR